MGTPLWDQILKRVEEDDWIAPEIDPENHPLRHQPAELFNVLHMTPDVWQKQLLESTARQILVCCSRQSGKSQTAAIKALHTALVQAPADVLIVSRAQRQSAELMRKVKELYAGLRGQKVRRGKPWQPFTLKKEVLREAEAARQGQYVPDAESTDAIRDSILSMELKNGSRIICLPGTAETIVGYSAIALLIIDEASKTRDEMYALLRPVLAVSKGQLLVLSTPFGKRGWFWEEWKHCLEQEAQSQPTRWERIQATAHECGRIDPTWLAQERASIGERWFSQEYECNPPEAPIWMGDFSFRPLGEVRAGDTVIGWHQAEAQAGAKYGKRYLTRSRVLGVRQREADLIEVQTESGRTLRCTPDHKWLMGNHPASFAYRPVKQVGDWLNRVIDPTPPLAEELRWDAAWLGGIYDGEGSADQIAQCPSHNPEIYGRIRSVLQSLGFRAAGSTHGLYFMGMTPEGKKQAVVNFINWCRPTVVDRFLDRMVLSAHFRHPDRVVEIRPVGRGTVVSMQTTTGNYIVWGYASKNCQFVDTVDMVFSHEDIHAMVSEEIEPLW
jgi:hypothetical protein